MSVTKSSLMTKDPYHIPGYIGYCPQFKYQIGETFGRTTSQLLGNNNIASSGRPVLAEINPVRPKSPPQDHRRVLLSRRAHNLGDQKLFDKMVPGYTGFIPRGEHHFGKRYAETSLTAVADFEQDQEECKRRLEDLHTIQDLQSGRPVAADKLNNNTVKLTTLQMPLKQVKLHSAVYYSKNAPQHSLSPLTMSNDNVKKFFMSGYTGFVPRTREHIGRGYPKITNSGLCDFTDECERIKEMKALPVVVQREFQKKFSGRPIYIKDMGMVPHYTGHVPGEKFRYGRTFGFSTKNAQPVKTN